MKTQQFKLDQETMDALDEIEYIMEVAHKERRRGNEFGYEVLSSKAVVELTELGISRRVARDLGWDL